MTRNIPAACSFGSSYYLLPWCAYQLFAQSHATDCCLDSIQMPR